MGYFLDYELFQPCWFCGRTRCNGNHPECFDMSTENENEAIVGREGPPPPPPPPEHVHVWFAQYRSRSVAAGRWVNLAGPYGRPEDARARLRVFEEQASFEAMNLETRVMKCALTGVPETT